MVVLVEIMVQGAHSYPAEMEQMVSAAAVVVIRTVSIRRRVAIPALMLPRVRW